MPPILSSKSNAISGKVPAPLKTRAFKITASIIATLILIFAIAPMFVDATILVKKSEGAISKELSKFGLAAQFEKGIQVSFIPSVRVKARGVGLVDSKTKSEVVKAKKILLKVKLLPLIFGKVDLSLIRIGSLDVNAKGVKRTFSPKGSVTKRKKAKSQKSRNAEAHWIDEISNSIPEIQNALYAAADLSNKFNATIQIPNLNLIFNKSYQFSKIERDILESLGFRDIDSITSISGVYLGLKNSRSKISLVASRDKKRLEFAIENFSRIKKEGLVDIDLTISSDKSSASIGGELALDFSNGAIGLIKTGELELLASNFPVLGKLFNVSCEIEISESKIELEDAEFSLAGFGKFVLDDLKIYKKNLINLLSRKPIVTKETRIAKGQAFLEYSGRGGGKKSFSSPSLEIKYPSFASAKLSVELLAGSIAISPFDLKVVGDTITFQNLYFKFHNLFFENFRLRLIDVDFSSPSLDLDRYIKFKPIKSKDRGKKKKEKFIFRHDTKPLNFFGIPSFDIKGNVTNLSLKGEQFQNLRFAAKGSSSEMIGSVVFSDFLGSTIETDLNMGTVNGRKNVKVSFIAPTINGSRLAKFVNLKDSFQLESLDIDIGISSTDVSSPKRLLRSLGGHGEVIVEGLKTPHKGAFDFIHSLVDGMPKILAFTRVLFDTVFTSNKTQPFAKGKFSYRISRGVADLDLKLTDAEGENRSYFIGEGVMNLNSEVIDIAIYRPKAPSALCVKGRVLDLGLSSISVKRAPGYTGPSTIIGSEVSELGSAVKDSGKRVFEGAVSMFGRAIEPGQRKR